MHIVLWVLGIIILLAGIISPLSIVICGVLGLILNGLGKKKKIKYIFLVHSKL